MLDPEQLPARRLARPGKHRGNAQALPKLAQAAQHSGFGKLPAQGFPRLRGGQRTILVVFVVQCLPQLEHQWRNLVAGGFFRSMLPIGIRAQAENIGQCLACHEKIRLLAYGAK
jgi:hypothetical protein